jgi:translation initiation factor IF-2
MDNINENVDEKRVTTTIIRRRKKAPSAKPAPEGKSAKEEASASEPTVEQGPEQAQATELEESQKKEIKAALEKEEPTATAKKGTDDKESVVNVVSDKKEKPKKIVKKRSRADFLMEEYQKAGGLKRAAELVVGSDDTAEIEPMERIFQPERQGRKKRVSSKKDYKKTTATVPSARKRRVRIKDTISVADLGQAMGVKAREVLKKLIDLGVETSLNEVIDFETASVVAQEFQYEVENIAFKEEDVISQRSAQDALSEDFIARAPVVTVMGHVDHGKTTLLDHIRQTKVAEGEAGGITQHIGACQIQTKHGPVTFIDTPGHEAFTAMRARGAQVTDIVILVVAADDGVKPQTIEALNHAKAAQVPIIVAINKMDTAGADADKVKRELSEHGLVAEDWGGDAIMRPISALSGDGVDALLEMLALQSEILELKANALSAGAGHILEAKMEKGRGVVATAIIINGSIKRGDAIVAGTHSGRVRAMHDWTGKDCDSAGPASAVEILGLSGVPMAGDSLVVVGSEEDAKKLAAHRQNLDDGRKRGPQAKMSLDDLFAGVAEKGQVELKIVIKADVQGSLEALKETIEGLSIEEVRVIVIHSGVGAISESDVRLADASHAVIIGFNVRPDAPSRRLAESEGVSIRVYRIIYEIVDDIKKAMVGLLAPTVQEEYLGRAEVRDTFGVSKVGTIAGCTIADGKILRGSHVRVLRDEAIVYEGKLSSLKRFKDDVKEVTQGYECGIGVENFNDVKIGDIIEAFEVKEVQATL